MVYLFVFLGLSVCSYFIGQIYIKSQIDENYEDFKLKKHAIFVIDKSTFSHNLKLFMDSLKELLGEILLSFVNVLEKIINIGTRLFDILLIVYGWAIIPSKFNKAIKSYQDKKDSKFD